MAGLLSNFPDWSAAGAAILFGRAGDALLRFAIFLAIAKVLSSGDFSLYALLTAALGTCQSLFSLASPRVTLFFHTRGVRGPLFGWLFLAAGGASAAVLGALLAAPGLRMLFFPKVSAGLLLLGIAPLPFLLLADSLSAALLSTGREALYARTLWTRTIAMAAVLGLSLLLEDRLMVILVGRLIVNALVTSWLAVAVDARPDWGGMLPVAAKAIRYGMPIAVGGGFVALHRRSDVFLLSALGRTGEIGGYALCYALAESFWLITDSLEAALFLDLTRRDDRSAVSAAWRAFRTYWAIGLAAAAGGLLVGEGLLQVVFRSRYQDAPGLFPWILFAAIAWGVVRPLSSYLFSRQRTKVVMGCHLAGLALNLSLCLLTIPRWGAWGAAVASLASYTFEGLLITLVFLRERDRVEVVRA